MVEKMIIISAIILVVLNLLTGAAYAHFVSGADAFAGIDVGEQSGEDDLVPGYLLGIEGQFLERFGAGFAHFNVDKGHLDHYMTYVSLYWSPSRYFGFYMRNTLGYQDKDFGNSIAESVGVGLQAGFRQLKPIAVGASDRRSGILIMLSGNPSVRTSQNGQHILASTKC